MVFGVKMDKCQGGFMVFLPKTTLKSGKSKPEFPQKFPFLGLGNR